MSQGALTFLRHRCVFQSALRRYGGQDENHPPTTNQRLRGCAVLSLQSSTDQCLVMAPAHEQYRLRADGLAGVTQEPETPQFAMCEPKMVAPSRHATARRQFSILLRDWGQVVVPVRLPEMVDQTY